MKRILYFFALQIVFVFCYSTSSAQNISNSFRVKFSDGTLYNINFAGGLILKDSTLSISATQKGNITHSFDIQLVFTDNKSKKNFTKGYYYFNKIDQMMDYIPGQSISYKAQVFYLQDKNGTTAQEWITDANPEDGFIEIETITDSRIKGRFSCELIQRLPVKGAKKMVEGSFDVEFRNQKAQ